ncbi:MAG TPA: ATP synthase subunit I [Casimicrobiaceae bacterium]|nr:ATP synthase subunit I [Casimicrobiaceae bacterium]
MQAPLSSKPIRRVLKWQAIATIVVAAVAGLWQGGHGALSAVLGGVVNVTAVVVYAVVLGISKPASAGGTVAAVFRAEAIKVLVIVLQLWVVLVTYTNLVAAAFFTSFVITVLLFRMALIERN